MNRFSLTSSSSSTTSSPSTSNSLTRYQRSIIQPNQNSSNNPNRTGFDGGISTVKRQSSNNNQVDAYLIDYFMNEMILSIRDSSKVSLKRSMKNLDDLKSSNSSKTIIKGNFLKNSNKTFETESKMKKDDDKEEEEEMKKDERSSELELELERFQPEISEIEEAYRLRMDSAGYKVGWILAERLCKDRPRFPRSTNPSNSSNVVPDQLEAIKFICKDVWIAIYNKQADNLRTNHRGIYVIQDHSYRPFTRSSTSIGYETELDDLCKKMLNFPLAVIRGALMNLGVQSIVSAEINLPQCTFQIRTASAMLNLNSNSPNKIN